MLRKLAFTGLKSRIKDYLVLFFGLVISGAIFYMFEALATNQDFIKANGSIVTGASFIFQFGSILLTIITLVYIFYANSFLMSMRRHDYGLFMMLGAKQRKIGQLILSETVLIGTLASLIGVVVGWVLTASLGGALMQQMFSAKLKGFQPFFWPAALATVLLYILLFILAGLINRRSLLKTPVLGLLKGDSEPNRPTLKPVQQIVQVVLGLVFLAIGYYVMGHMQLLVLMSIPVALVTIVAGTYFLFNAVFVWLVLMAKRLSWAQRGLHNFTLSQLSFRIRNYTRILSIVSILFALALGAITVGMGFQRQITTMATAQSAYTMAISDPSKKVSHDVSKLNRDLTVAYSQVVSKHNVYFNANQVQKTPFETIAKDSQVQAQIKSGKLQPTRYAKRSLASVSKQPSVLLLDLPNWQRTRNIHVVSGAKFNQLKGERHQLLMFRVTNLADSQAKLKQISRQVGGKQATLMPGTYAIYTELAAIFGGLEFMGFFLGIAFLAMLASCLMFKILSGAAGDKRRYIMLNKIGTRTGVLRRSISQEVAVLFALPGVLGMIDVIFGLKMFRGLLLSPYDRLWLPFTIFLVLYIIYYIITIIMYQKIVIPNVKIEK